MTVTPIGAVEPIRNKERKQRAIIINPAFIMMNQIVNTDKTVKKELTTRWKKLLVSKRKGKWSLGGERLSVIIRSSRSVDKEIIKSLFFRQAVNIIL